MELQPMRQLEYLQRTLSIFLANPADISEQFEALIKDLIKENKQSGKSPKTSPEPIASDSKPEAPTASSPPHPLPKKRSAPVTANTKPPPSKRLKSAATKDEEQSAKKVKTQAEEKPTAMDKDDDIYDDENSSDDSKSKSSESQDNPSTSATSRGIDEFVIEMGLVCSKCMVLTEEKDNRLVECHECRTKYHQKCHKPAVSTSDISDPRCLWYCSKCRKLINKRQQPQSSIKESKTNSNTSTLNNKSKPLESPLSAGKKGLLTSITDVPAGIFSFKPKSSESITSDGTTTSNPSASSSTSSLSNGTTPKSTNAWASLATGCKEKKTTPEAPSTSASSVLTELSALTSSSNSNAVKRSPPSPKSLPSTSLNPLLRQTSNGAPTSGVSSLKNASSSGKPTTPSSPPVLKTQLSSSKSTQKLLPTTKSVQRVSSPTPLGRPTSLLKSPPPTATPAYNRLNSSGSNSSGSSSPSSAPNANVKIATGLDFGKRLKELQKKAAEKSLTKKF